MWSATAVAANGQHGGAHARVRVARHRAPVVVEVGAGGEGVAEMHRPEPGPRAVVASGLRADLGAVELN